MIQLHTCTQQTSNLLAQWTSTAFIMLVLQRKKVKEVILDDGILFLINKISKIQHPLPQKKKKNYAVNQLTINICKVY